MSLHKKKIIKYGSLTQDTVEIRRELIVNSRLLKCLKCLETMNFFRSSVQEIEDREVMLAAKFFSNGKMSLHSVSVLVGLGHCL